MTPCLFFVLFKTGSHNVAQAGLEIPILQALGLQICTTTLSSLYLFCLCNYNLLSTSLTGISLMQGLYSSVSDGLYLGREGQPGQIPLLLSQAQ
jgi:hypothetical protein